MLKKYIFFLSSRLHRQWYENGGATIHYNLLSENRLYEKTPIERFISSVKTGNILQDYYSFATSITQFYYCEPLPPVIENNSLNHVLLDLLLREQNSIDSHKSTKAFIEENISYLLGIEVVSSAKKILFFHQKLIKKLFEYIRTKSDLENVAFFYRISKRSQNINLVQYEQLQQ